MHSPNLINILTLIACDPEHRTVLTMRYRPEDDRIVMEGGYRGAHSVAADSTAERVVAHWEGYLEDNGLEPRGTVGALYRAGDAIVRVTRINKWGAIYGLLSQADGSWTLEVELEGPEDDDGDDDDWRREQAMEAGMLHGVQAYNEAMGWDVETEDR